MDATLPVVAAFKGCSSSNLSSLLLSIGPETANIWKTALAEEFREENGRKSLNHLTNIIRENLVSKNVSCCWGSSAESPVLAISSGPLIFLYDPQTGARISTISTSEESYSSSSSPSVSKSSNFLMETNENNDQLSAAAAAAAEVIACRFIRLDRSIVYCAAPNIIRIYDRVRMTNVEEHRPSLGGTVTALACSRDDGASWIALGTSLGVVCLINRLLGESISLVSPFVQKITSLEFSAQSRNLLTAGCNDGRVCYWRVDTGLDPVATFDAEAGPIVGVMPSLVNRLTLVSASRQGAVAIYDLAGARIVKTFTYPYIFTGLAYRFDGITIALGTICGKIILIDLRRAISPVSIIEVYDKNHPVIYITFHNPAPTRRSSIMQSNNTPGRRSSIIQSNNNNATPIVRSLSISSLGTINRLNTNLKISTPILGTSKVIKNDDDDDNLLNHSPILIENDLIISNTLLENVNTPNKQVQKITSRKNQYLVHNNFSPPVYNLQKRRNSNNKLEEIQIIN